MEKLKLTITNNGCNPIKVFGRPCIDIPAQGTVTTIRPATSQTTALIERHLKARSLKGRGKRPTKPPPSLRPPQRAKRNRLHSPVRQT